MPADGCSTPTDRCPWAHGLRFVLGLFDGDRFHGYKSEENTWPPSADTVRCTYSTRASTNNPDPKPSVFATDGVLWTTGNSFANEPFYPLKPTNGSTNANSPKAEMFKLAKLKGKAIVSDVSSSPTRVKPAHVKGINVLYANGSVRWVPRTLIKTPLNQCSGTSAANNAAQDAIWKILAAQ